MDPYSKIIFFERRCTSDPHFNKDFDKLKSGIPRPNTTSSQDRSKGRAITKCKSTHKHMEGEELPTAEFQKPRHVTPSQVELGKFYCNTFST